jgi:hypothetical protein
MSQLVKTKHQANFKDFKRFGAFKGFVKQKNVVFNQGGLKLQAWTLAVLPHSLVGHSMTYGVPKILKRIRHLK